MPRVKTSASARSRTRRRLPKPRATHANSTVPATMKPAQAMSAICANRPALTQRNGIGSNFSACSGMSRQPLVKASNPSHTPSTMIPAATTAGMKFGPMPA
jgi:hypothetical protein